VLVTARFCASRRPAVVRVVWLRDHPGPGARGTARRARLHGRPTSCAAVDHSSSFTPPARQEEVSTREKALMLERQRRRDRSPADHDCSTSPHRLGPPRIHRQLVDCPRPSTVTSGAIRQRCGPRGVRRTGAEPLPDPGPTPKGRQCWPTSWRTRRQVAAVPWLSSPPPNGPAARRDVMRGPGIPDSCTSGSSPGSGARASAVAPGWGSTSCAVSSRRTAGRSRSGAHPPVGRGSGSCCPPARRSSSPALDSRCRRLISRSRRMSAPTHDPEAARDDALKAIAAAADLDALKQVRLEHAGDRSPLALAKPRDRLAAGDRAGRGRSPGRHRPPRGGRGAERREAERETARDAGCAGRRGRRT